MPGLRKLHKISSALHEDIDELIKKMYLEKRMSSIEISDELYRLSNIRIHVRSVQRRLKALGAIRTYSEAFQLAIKKGRKTYDALKRPIKSSELRKGINIKLRYKIMLRDGFRCVLCGKTAKDDRLVVDHTVPVVFGGTNDENNLRTLCRECNHGKMLLEERKLK